MRSLLADPESDYDSDLLGVAYKPAGAVRAPASYRGVPAAYFDPKAAEFNQYLLEQHELGGELAGSRLSSDEEEPYVGGSNAGLTRSRSCILAGPSTSGKQQAKPTHRKSGQADHSKMAASSWDLSGRGPAS